MRNASVEAPSRAWIDMPFMTPARYLATLEVFRQIGPMLVSFAPG